MGMKARCADIAKTPLSQTHLVVRSVTEEKTPGASLTEFYLFRWGGVYAGRSVTEFGRGVTSVTKRRSVRFERGCENRGRRTLRCRRGLGGKSLATGGRLSLNTIAGHTFA